MHPPSPDVIFLVSQRLLLLNRGNCVWAQLASGSCQEEPKGFDTDQVLDLVGFAVFIRVESPHRAKVTSRLPYRRGTLQPT